MIDIIFRNPYLLLIGGAGLITSTCFWFFQKSRLNQPTKSLSPKADAPVESNGEPKVTEPAPEKPQASSPTDTGQSDKANQNAAGTPQTPTSGSTGQKGTITHVVVNVPSGDGAIDTSKVIEHIGQGGKNIKK